jgi:hypothetical protein
MRQTIQAKLKAEKYTIRKIRCLKNMKKIRIWVETHYSKTDLHHKCLVPIYVFREMKLCGLLFPKQN